MLLGWERGRDGGPVQVTFGSSLSPKVAEFPKQEVAKLIGEFQATSHTFYVLTSYKLYWSQSDVWTAVMNNFNFIVIIYGNQESTKRTTHQLKHKFITQVHVAWVTMCSWNWKASLE